MLAVSCILSIVDWGIIVVSWGLECLAYILRRRHARTDSLVVYRVFCLSQPCYKLTFENVPVLSLFVGPKLSALNALEDGPFGKSEHVRHLLDGVNVVAGIDDCPVAGAETTYTPQEWRVASI